jgi:hypothetical protein
MKPSGKMPTINICDKNLPLKAFDVHVRTLENPQRATHACKSDERVLSYIHHEATKSMMSFRERVTSKHLLRVVA